MGEKMCHVRHNDTSVIMVMTDVSPLQTNTTSHSLHIGPNQHLYHEARYWNPTFMIKNNRSGTHRCQEINFKLSGWSTWHMRKLKMCIFTTVNPATIDINPFQASWIWPLSALTHMYFMVLSISCQVSHNIRELMFFMLFGGWNFISELRWLFANRWSDFHDIDSFGKVEISAFQST